MKAHELKIRSIYFDRIALGQKTFEIRKNDRDFQTGDTVILREINIDNPLYSGRELSYKIGYVFSGEEFGVQKGYCVFSLISIN